MQPPTTDWSDFLCHFSDPNCQKQILSHLEVLCERDGSLEEAFALFTGTAQNSSRVLSTEERVAAATCARYFLRHCPPSVLSPSFQMGLYLSLLLQQFLCVAPTDPSSEALGVATRVTLLALLRSIVNNSKSNSNSSQMIGALVVQCFTTIEHEVSQAANNAVTPFVVTRVAQLLGMLAEDLAPALLKLPTDAFGAVTLSLCRIYDSVLLTAMDQLLAQETTQGSNLFYHAALVESLTTIVDSFQALLSESIFILSPAVLTQSLAQRVQGIHQHIQHHYMEQLLLPQAQQLFSTECNLKADVELAARKCACGAHLSLMAYMMAIADADDTYLHSSKSNASALYQHSVLQVTIQAWQYISYVTFIGQQQQQSSDLLLNRVVLSSLDFLAEWAAHAPGSLVNAFGADGGSALMSSLLHALCALLHVPRTVAMGEDNSTLLTTTPDMVSDVRVALAKGPARRSQGRKQTKQRRKGARRFGSSQPEDVETDDDEDEVAEEASADDDDSDDEDDEEVAIGLDTLFEDHGSRRRAAAWMLNCFSFAEELLFPLQQALLPLALTKLQTLQEAYDKWVSLQQTGQDGQQASLVRIDAFVDAEALLFMVSQVVEELLCVLAAKGTTASASYALTSVEHLTQSAMQWLNRFDPRYSAFHLSGGDENVPFYFRLTVVGIFARLFSSENENSSSVSLIRFVDRMGGVESMLSALVELALTETNKMVVNEIVDAVQIILLSILSVSSIEEESDEEEQEEANNNKKAVQKISSGGGGGATNTAALHSSLPHNCDVATTLLARLLRDGILAGRFQLGARVALYRLLEKTVPLIAAHLPPNSPNVMTLLELLAQQYMARCEGSDTNVGCVFSMEGECLLSCICEVCEAAGEQLTPALSWVVQVSRAVLQVFMQLPADGSTVYGTVDTEDVAMLALDLLSCSCTALLDRNNSATAYPSFLLLQQALGQEVAGGQQPLAELCLEVCERVLQRAHQSTEREEGEEEESFLRHACFSVLYDCVYLFPSHFSFIARIHHCCVDSLCLDFFTTTAAATITTATPPALSPNWSESSSISNALLCWTDTLQVMDQHPDAFAATLVQDAARTRCLLQALLNVYTPSFVQYHHKMVLKINLTHALLSLLVHESRQTNTTTPAVLLLTAAQLQCLLDGVKLFLNEDDGTAYEFHDVSFSLAQVLLSVAQHVVAGTAPSQLTSSLVKQATVAGIKWWLKGCEVWGSAVGSGLEAWHLLVHGAVSHGWLSSSLRKQAEKMFR